MVQGRRMNAQISDDWRLSPSPLPFRGRNVVVQRIVAATGKCITWGGKRFNYFSILLKPGIHSRSVTAVRVRKPGHLEASFSSIPWETNTNRLLAEFYTLLMSFTKKQPFDFFPFCWTHGISPCSCGFIAERGTKKRNEQNVSGN